MTNQIGLTSAEAKKRLLKDGPNEVVPSRLNSSFQEIKKLLLDPMGLMLLGLAGLHGVIGNTTDALILLAAYVPVTAVDVLLELRTQRVLRSLRSNLSTKAHVLRDNTILEIPTKDIVLGDVLVFDEGQSLPADGSILEASSMTINESALTGESLPIEKSIGSPFFAGTTLMQGRGLGLVEKTGRKTQFGKIASLLEETKSQQSPLQRKVNALVKKVLIVALLLAIFLFAIELVRGHSLVESLIIAMTFGMSAVPEEFPLVFTLYLSLGAWRLSKHGVLIRSLPSVEALGNVDVICTDKTGTLTEGRFDLQELYPLSSDTGKNLWQFAIMACEEKAIDSMEIAIFQKGQSHLHHLEKWMLTSDYPFENTGKHMSHVWTHKNDSKTLIAMKGAVEGVLEHCTTTASERAQINSAVEKFASQGQRILGLAGREGPCTGRREDDEQGLTFLGLLVFSDPIRQSAKEAIAICQESGIEVKMLTGDHPVTAHAVAEQTGIKHSDDAIFTGDQLLKSSVEDRALAYRNGTIFSRVRPEQKHEMVQALKSSGKIVAMTGDGINDAPALKLADIGISMGLNATDVARSTAQMILLKNDFHGLVESIFEGRRIFANLRRSFSYLISFHIPVILLALLPPLMGWGELLLPIHIVLLELVVHPISAFAFENLPITTSQRERSLLPPKRLLAATASGIFLSLIALILFRWQEVLGNTTRARSFGMAAILIGNMFFVLIESGFSINKRVGLTILSLILASWVIFSFTPLTNLLHLGF